MPRSERLRGLLIVGGGVLILTPDTLLLRLLSADPWTVVFWRGLLMGLTLLAAQACQYRGRTIAQFTGIGIGGVVAALLYAITSIAFVDSLSHTSVANALVILAAAPLFAAVFARIFLGERTRVETWAAILVAVAGVSVVVSDGLGQGTLRGDAVAILATATLAAMLVTLRQNRTRNMVPAIAFGGLLAAAVMLPLTDPFAVSDQDTVILGLLGVVILPASFALITRGPRYLPAAEVALLVLLETVLGPFWVWLALGEEPSAMVLAGGMVVIAAIAGHSFVTLRAVAAGST